MSRGKPIVINPEQGQVLGEVLQAPRGGLLSASSNTIGRYGQLLVRPGLSAVGNAITDAATAIIAFTDQNDNSVAIIGTPTRWYVFNPSTQTWTDLSGGSLLAGNNAFPVTLAPFMQGTTQAIVGCNNVDHLHYWRPGDAAYTNVPGAPISGTLGTGLSRIMCGNISGNPRRVQWSGLADATSWPSGAFSDLSDLANPIDVVKMLNRTTFAIYSDEGEYVAIAQPGTDANAFAFLRVDNQPGPLGPSAVDFGPSGTHYYIGTDYNLYTFDGQCHLLATTQPVLVSHINQNAIDTVSLCYLPHWQEVWVFLPFGTDAAPKNVMVYSLISNTVNIFSVANSIYSCYGRWAVQTQSTWSNLPSVNWNALPDVPWANLGISQTGELMAVGLDTNVATFQSNSDFGTAISFDWQYLLPVVPGEEYVCDGVEIICTPSTDVVTISVLVGDAIDDLTEKTIASSASLVNGFVRSINPMNQEIRGRVMVLRIKSTTAVQVDTIKRIEAWVWTRPLAA